VQRIKANVFLFFFLMIFIRIVFIRLFFSFYSNRIIGIMFTMTKIAERRAFRRITFSSDISFSLSSIGMRK
jgi:sensor histidine kinase YesM